VLTHPQSVLCGCMVPYEGQAPWMDTSTSSGALVDDLSSLLFEESLSLRQGPADQSGLNSELNSTTTEQHNHFSDESGRPVSACDERLCSHAHRTSVPMQIAVPAACASAPSMAFAPAYCLDARMPSTMQPTYTVTTSLQLTPLGARDEELVDRQTWTDSELQVDAPCAAPAPHAMPPVQWADATRLTRPAHWQQPVRLQDLEGVASWRTPDHLGRASKEDMHHQGDDYRIPPAWRRRTPDHSGCASKDGMNLRVDDYCMPPACALHASAVSSAHESHQPQLDLAAASAMTVSRSEQDATISGLSPRAVNEVGASLEDALSALYDEEMNTPPSPAGLGEPHLWQLQLRNRQMQKTQKQVQREHVQMQSQQMQSQQMQSQQMLLQQMQPQQMPQMQPQHTREHRMRTQSQMQKQQEAQLQHMQLKREVNGVYGAVLHAPSLPAQARAAKAAPVTVKAQPPLQPNASPVVARIISGAPGTACTSEYSRFYMHSTVQAHLPSVEDGMARPESSVVQTPLTAGALTDIEPAADATERLRMVWTSKEDHIIESAVSCYGHKWRKIAALLPNRSDDAVRNRWHRLEICRRYQQEKEQHFDRRGQPTNEQRLGYKCSRCGKPKKHHICLAPDDARLHKIKRRRRPSEAIKSPIGQAIEQTIPAATTVLSHG